MRLTIARSIADGRHDTTDASLVHRDLATGPPPNTRCGLLAQHAEVALLRGLVVAPVGCQLDQLVHQRGQFLGLTVEIVDQLLPRLGGEVVHPAQHGDVGAQAGQRRTQFVARHPAPAVAADRDCAPARRACR